MKVFFWVAGAVVLSCLVFPPLFFVWVVSLALWLLAERTMRYAEAFRSERARLSTTAKADPMPVIGPDTFKAEVSVVEAVGNEYRPKEMREQVESTLSAPGLYETIPTKFIHAWEERAQLVVLPPDEWRISGAPGEVFVDPDWVFPLKAASEEDCQLYIYTVKDSPNLHKIGIAKDVLKRKEKYFGRCIEKWTLPKRDAVLIEYLFKHATYGLANNDLPQWNVGNLDEENMRQEILELSKRHPDSKGISEVRIIAADAAKVTIKQIREDLMWHLKVDELILKYGIQTFRGDLSGRGTIHIPHRFWRFKPHHEPEKPSTSDANYETRKEIYKSDLQEYKQELRLCWDPKLIP